MATTALALVPSSCVDGVFVMRGDPGGWATKAADIGTDVSYAAAGAAFLCTVVTLFTISCRRTFIVHPVFRYLRFVASTLSTVSLSPICSIDVLPLSLDAADSVVVGLPLPLSVYEA